MDLVALIVILPVALAALLVRARFRRARGRSGAAPATAAGVAASRPDGSRLYDLSAQLLDFYAASAHPEDLRSHPSFADGVSLLCGREYSGHDLARYFAGDNAVISCMAVEALRTRREGDGLESRILEALPSVAPWPLFFGLQYLGEVVPPDRALVGGVLARLTDRLDNRMCRDFVEAFVRERIARGEVPRFADELSGVGAQDQASLAKFLGSLEPPIDALQGELRRWQRERVDTELLGSIGTLWPAEGRHGDSALRHVRLDAHIAAVEAELGGGRPRSVLLIGESGVGKTKLAYAVARRLQEQGWLIFEASASALIAGQVFIGQFEQRMQQLLAQLRRRRVLWLVPDFHALAESGTHSHSATSALDLLLPHAENGEIAILGECEPGPFEQLSLRKPRVTTALALRRLDPLPAEEALELARSWWEAHAEPEGRDGVLTEAWELAQQYLADRAPPGNLLRLLEITTQRLVGNAPEHKARIRIDDLIVTLSALSGLPTQILDERQGLDTAALRARFRSRVIGQDEAVECLVERIAMVKAGLTDPSRPLGVFLFAGPTGTGKTEIAKTLAEFLFGSTQRMIRVDMSELQSPEDLDRLVGSSEPRASGDALVNRIREQPFSVVLLDEFEKAHPRSWDLFLQVFDDGRLTDRRGRVADFRYAILVLTSNLGAALPSSDPLGFRSGGEAWSARGVTRAIEAAFRPELLNRLDRIVVFRPLDRETMRSILRKELEDVMQRRGLRTRPWAVEWDPAAIEFLLEEGFSPTLGARPLKRAIERHLLAPLAQTIVGHAFPKGDQFLYVTRGEGALEVQFIDPDAPREPAHAPAARIGDAPAGALAAIALDPRGTADELELLEQRFQQVLASVEGAAWRERKDTALAMTGLEDFWRSPDRFEILGQYEYQGRIEAGVRRTGSLLQRLRRRDHRHLPTQLLASVAQTLRLLELARDDIEQGRPHAAFLEVEAGLETGIPSVANDQFAAEIGRMYRSWAARRHMRMETLGERPGNERLPYRLRVSVSGYAACSILLWERGLHVLETPAIGPRSFERSRARVRVVPQQGDPGDGGVESLRKAADAALAAAEASDGRIARRYRAQPSPLVRDGVRGWRTGRLDRVLAGDFDLIAEI